MREALDYTLRCIARKEGRTGPHGQDKDYRAHDQDADGNTETQ